MNTDLNAGEKCNQSLKCLSKGDCIVRLIFPFIFVGMGIWFSFNYNKWFGADNNSKYLLMTILFISWLFSYLCLRISYVKYKESKIREICLDSIGEAKEIRQIKDTLDRHWNEIEKIKNQVNNNTKR